jgi:hypothetical protein
LIGGLSEPARKALYGEAWSRDLGWRLRLGANLVDLLDDRYPGLIEVAEAAAKRLEGTKKRGKPALGPDPRLTKLAAVLAVIYATLTGKEPPTSGKESPFSTFVDAIFAAGGFKGTGNHYGQIGVKRAREKAGQARQAEKVRRAERARRAREARQAKARRARETGGA